MNTISNIINDAYGYAQYRQPDLNAQYQQRLALLQQQYPQQFQNYQQNLQQQIPQYQQPSSQYQQPLQPIQQPQQQPIPTGLNGRSVNNIDDVKNIRDPLEGVFPSLQSENCIYVRFINNDGLTQISTYKLDANSVPTKVEYAEKQELNGINDTMKSLQESINSLGQQIKDLEGVIIDELAK